MNATMQSDDIISYTCQETYKRRSLLLMLLLSVKHTHTHTRTHARTHARTHTPHVLVDAHMLSCMDHFQELSANQDTFQNVFGQYKRFLV